MLIALMMILGFAGLIIGAEMLVRGGSNVAIRMGIAPITIGLTVVAIGTSVPELAVGLDAASRGNAGLAVGNIVGTNLVNLLLILGLSAMIRAIPLASRTLWFDLPAMTLIALITYTIGRDGVLTTFDGWLLLLLAIFYTYFVLRVGRNDPALDLPDGEVPTPVRGGFLRDAASLLGGMVIIVIGADLLVESAVSTAERLGVSDVVIGLTVVAIGTSAPELVTTLISTFRGNRDLALGNLLGSSVYNLALILGATAVAAPGNIPVPADISIDLLLMALVTVICVPVFLTGSRISRAEGTAFVAAYGVYLWWIVAIRA